MTLAKEPISITSSAQHDMLLVFRTVSMTSMPDLSCAVAQPSIHR
jgi:hypothetical protein